MQAVHFFLSVLFDIIRKLFPKITAVTQNKLSLCINSSDLWVIDCVCPLKLEVSGLNNIFQHNRLEDQPFLWHWMFHIIHSLQLTVKCVLNAAELTEFLLKTLWRGYNIYKYFRKCTVTARGITASSFFSMHNFMHMCICILDGTYTQKRWFFSGFLVKSRNSVMQALNVPAILEVIFHQLGLHGTADSHSPFTTALWANHSFLIPCDA